MTSPHDPTASYALLKEELEPTFSVREYDIARRHYVEYTHPNKQVWLTTTQHFSYPLNHGAIMEMADNKTLAYEWMEQFPVAQAATVSLSNDEIFTNSQAEKWLGRHKQLVVKPESSFASQGLTLDISSTQQLAEAIIKARSTRQLTDSIIIQEQVEGSEIRLTVLNGKVVSVIHRQPAQLVGDGINTIEELIKIENIERDKINSTSMVEYPHIEHIVQKYDFDVAYLPQKDEIIQIANSTMISGGASVFEVLDKVDPSYVLFVENVIARLGAAFLVVDLFTKDFRVPMTSSNTYFNEFNKAPALKMYYSSRNSNNYDIVPALSKAITQKMETLA